MVDAIRAADKLLEWDASIISDDQARAKLNSFRPIEMFLDFPLKEDPLTLTPRDRYKMYIADAFPKLAAIIGAKWAVKLGDSEWELLRMEATAA